jgi:hypothetical protein
VKLDKTLKETHKILVKLWSEITHITHKVMLIFPGWGAWGYIDSLVHYKLLSASETVNQHFCKNILEIFFLKV